MIRRLASVALVAVVGTGVVSFAPAARAGGDWALCGAGLQVPARPASEFEGADPEATHVSADRADLVQEGMSVLRGNVQIIHAKKQLQADTVTLTRPQQILDAEGNIRYWEDGVYASGANAHIDLEADQSSLEKSRFIMRDAHARGGADLITLSNRELALIDGAVFTTCDPANEEWVLRASHIELDRIEEWGSARNVVVRFKGVPIFYSPYMSFPLSKKRKTGFLTPGYRVSGETGFELQVPYYWNIAPNQDATFTARGMTRRGVMLQGEYRYLMERGFGQVGVEYLPHDAERGDDRAAISLQHDGSFAPGWNTDVDVDWVSDKNYFEELGTNLDISSISFLERRGDLSYAANRWWARGRVQDYQTVDQTIPGASRPYKRLPQLQLGWSNAGGNRRLNLRLGGEFVNFDRRDSVTGTRLDLKPTISYPIRSASAFFVPRLSAEFTGYYLDSTPAGASDNPTRAIPTFSADTGLFLERDLSIGGRGYVQTIEPRIFYLFVPFDDQGDLPVFDTGEFTFNFAQLFREDRFSGVDRVADANQLTVALTSRLLSADDAEELFRVSLGQIRFFRDRRVRLPGDARLTESGSDIVGEFAAKLYGDWRVSAGFQWNTNDSRTDRNTIRLRYQPDAQRVVNLEYRFVRDAVEQTDLSFRWPFGRSWGAVGRWNYAVPEGRTLEAFGGVEYESCCWAARAVVRRFLRNTQGDFDNAVFLQLELKGLAGIGRGAAAFLRRSIPGYRNTF